MKTFFIDVSGSMGDKRIVSAFDRVSDDWKEGDAVIAFNSFDAVVLTFQDMVNYAIEIHDVSHLKMTLLKKSIHNRWFRAGAIKAIHKSFKFSNTICLTDGFMSIEDMKKFNKVIVVEDPDIVRMRDIAKTTGCYSNR